MNACCVRPRQDFDIGLHAPVNEVRQRLSPVPVPLRRHAVLAFPEPPVAAMAGLAQRPKRDSTEEEHNLQFLRTLALQGEIRAHEYPIIHPPNSPPLCGSSVKSLFPEKGFPEKKTENDWEEGKWGGNRSLVSKSTDAKKEEFVFPNHCDALCPFFHRGLEIEGHE